jgi:hypothetical protein
MFLIIAALIGEVSFMCVNLCNKRLRNNGTSTQTVLALSGLTAPIWIMLSVYFFYTSKVEISFDYILALGGWLALCLFFNYGGVYLSRFQSLSEGTGYKFAMSIIFAWLVDYFFFTPVAEAGQSVSILLCFFGGLLLSVNRDKSVSEDMVMPLWKRLIATSVLAIVGILMYSTYKVGANIQESPLVHLSISHAILLCVLLVFGTKKLRVDVTSGAVPYWYIIALFFLMLIAATASTYAIAGLSITYLMLFALIRSTVFAVHDMWTKELNPTAMNIGAVVMILSGILYMSYLKL